MLTYLYQVLGIDRGSTLDKVLSLEYRKELLNTVLEQMEWSAIDKIFGLGHRKLPCFIETQNSFYKRHHFCELKKLDDNLVNKMQDRAQLLHENWGRGSFIMQCKFDYENQKCPLISFFTGDPINEFIDFFIKYFDSSFKINDFVVWFPLKIINVIFNDWYHAEFMKDTSLYSYVMDLGFHVFFISETHNMTYFQCYYVMGASKVTIINLHHSLKRYFNPNKHSKDRLNWYSAKKFKKLLSLETWNKLKHHKLRDHIMSSLCDEYLSYYIQQKTNQHITLKKEDCSYSYQDLLNDRDLYISITYDDGIGKSKLLKILDVVSDPEHHKMAKPIIESVNKTDFREFVSYFDDDHEFDGKYEGLSLMKVQVIKSALIELECVRIDNMRCLFGIWTYFKRQRLAKIFKDSLNEYFQDSYDAIFPLKFIRVRILENKLWGNKYCGYCHIRNNTKLCCGCYSVWYCCKNHQKLHWLHHRNGCKEICDMINNMNFYAM